MKQVYFISDPYWETATDVSYFEIRRIGLKHGAFVRIIRTRSNTAWQEPNRQETSTNNQSSLKSRIETLLADGEKVILSPFWWRDFERDMPELSTGQLLLLGAPSQNPQVQSVISDLEAGYYQMGQVAADFIQKHPERQRSIAMFYRGSSYDKYFNAFTSGYNEQNPPPGSMETYRYYAAEINELNLALEKIDVSQSLLILGMAQLSNLVYRRLQQEENALFMVEDFGDNPDPYQQILLSLDIDYRQLMDKALAVQTSNTELSTAETETKPVERVPYTLNLPNPELLRDLEKTTSLAEEALAKRKRQYQRIDRIIARTWERLLTFAAEFRISDISLPDWLKL